MKVIDLAPEYESLYCQCLEDWSDEIKEAGDHKARYYQRMKDRGLGVKLALDDRGEVGGMIQYVPVQWAPIKGRDLYFVMCIWVHGHKKGRGNFQKRGMGRALLQAAEEDVRARGARGLAAWGLSLPFFMRASWFKKHGYRPVDKLGMQVLLWKPFSESGEPPRWIRPKKKPEPIAGKVRVTALSSGWCPVQSMALERARRAAAEVGDKVEFEVIEAYDQSTTDEWGMSDGLFIDDREVRTGPPPSFNKIKKRIVHRAKRLH